MTRTSGPGWSTITRIGALLNGPWLRGQAPLFGIDVWEHAYHVKYQNRRADYLSAILQVLNWDYISARYEKAA